MQALTVPTLVLTGDEDWPCLAPNILMEADHSDGGIVGDGELRACDQSGGSSDGFNRIVSDFLAQVDAGRWPTRDPRAVTASITPGCGPPRGGGWHLAVRCAKE